ncbi:MAG: hypothetical protein AAGI23_08085 [Bacteroidota bacterium]
MITPIQTLPQLQQELRLLVAEDRIEPALERLKKTSEEKSLSTIQTQTLQQTAKWSEFKSHRLANTLSFEQLSVMKAQIVASTIELINQLTAEQKEEVTAERPPKSVTEKTLKTQVLILLLVSKLGLFFWLQLQWESGGFGIDQFIGTVGLLIPVLASYTFLVIKDFFKASDNQSEPKYYSRSVLIWAYTFIFIYTFLIFNAISWKGQGNLSYVQMNSLLATFEAVFGALIGQMLMDMFGKE